MDQLSVRNAISILTFLIKVSLEDGVAHLTSKKQDALVVMLEHAKKNFVPAIPLSSDDLDTQECNYYWEEQMKTAEQLLSTAFITDSDEVYVAETEVNVETPMTIFEGQYEDDYDFFKDGGVADAA